MDFRFPIFVRTKDCGDVTEFSAVADMQREFERIDVENEEYEAWDANGVPLSLSVQEPVWLRVEAQSSGAKPVELANAIMRFAQAVGIEVDLSDLGRGGFSAALGEVRAAIERKQKSKSWLQRFLSRF